MFSLLETKEEIAKAHRKLVATIHREFNRKVIRDIGYPAGATREVEVYTNGHYWFFTFNGSDHSISRQFNWFGLYNPSEVDLHISVEINTPIQGRTGQIAGFFARDNETGAIYLMHSGGVGGGTKGVGKEAFLAWRNDSLEEVVDSIGGKRTGVVVMPIEGVAAIRSAIRYIDIVAEFKKAVREGKIHTPEFQEKQKNFADFYSESYGMRVGKRSEEIDYLSRHGEVVDALHDWRKSNSLVKGSRLVKSQLIDLGIEVTKDLVEVYEVKTDTNRSTLYAAIGQLMVHGTADRCRRVIVVPEDEPIKAEDIIDALRRLKIELLKFRLTETEAIILTS